MGHLAKIASIADTASTRLCCCREGHSVQRSHSTANWLNVQHNTALTKPPNQLFSVPLFQGVWMVYCAPNTMGSSSCVLLSDAGQRLTQAAWSAAGTNNHNNYYGTVRYPPRRLRNKRHSDTAYAPITWAWVRSEESFLFPLVLVPFGSASNASYSASIIDCS